MKDSILGQIRKNKPDLVELPKIPVFNTKEVLVDTFVDSLKEVGAKVVRCSSNLDIEAQIKIHFPEAIRIVNTISHLGIKGLDLNTIDHPRELHPLDLSIIQGSFGVIENGAIWINPDSLKTRAIPFIGEHLVIVLDQADVVSNMHEAYARLEKDDAGYGVFIAGPSKTADIEQCLVIGAQGARSLLVVIKDF